MNRIVKKTGIFLVVAVCLLLAVFVVFHAKSEIFTIGIAIDASGFTQAVDGFKDCIAELEYVEGENIKYISYGFIENYQGIIDSETKRPLSDDVDMLLTVGNYSTLWAKKAAEGTDITVLFTMINCDPVDEGIVESLHHPGGNVTGIQVSNLIPKALEWLIRITPGAKKVYLPYNPAEEVSVLALTGLSDTASKLGVELVLHEVHSVEETVAAIEGLPEDVDAVFRIPVPTLDLRDSELSQAAIKRKLPMGSARPTDESVLVTFSPSHYETGRQAARLAHLIIQGAKPGDLPVETSEVLLTINIKTAEKLGIHVPNDVLAQAKTIIR